MLKWLIAFVMLANLAMAQYLPIWDRSGNQLALYSSTTPPAPWQIPEYTNSVLWYKFDTDTNSLGQVLDHSYLATNVAYAPTNAPIYNSASNGIAGHYNFAQSRYISSRMATASKTNSFSMWLKSNSTGWTGGAGGNFILDYRGTRFVLIKAQSSSVGYTTYDTSLHGFSPNTYHSATWELVTFAQNSATQMTMYIGNSVTPRYAILREASLSGTNRIGSDGASIANTLDACLTDLIIWSNTVLTANQHLDIWSNTISTHGWSNSLYFSNNSLWSNTVAEYNMDYNWPADTSKVGTNHVTTVNGSVFNANGSGGWYTDDGVDDYFRYALPLIPNDSTNYTMSCSFIPTVTNVARQYIMGCNAGNTNASIGIELALDRIVFSTYSNGFANVTGSALVSTTAWNRVAVTCAGTNGTIYLNNANIGNGVVKGVQGLIRSEQGALNALFDYKGARDRHIYITNCLNATEIQSL